MSSGVLLVPTSLEHIVTRPGPCKKTISNLLIAKPVAIENMQDRYEKYRTHGLVPIGSLVGILTQSN